MGAADRRGHQRARRSRQARYGHRDCDPCARHTDPLAPECQRAGEVVREDGADRGEEGPHRSPWTVDLVTIDGADARDFDDAVYCESTRNGWRLLVAIADVSHYVEIDSPLDQEALKRGTSVYFPDRVVPMLPESLSNGLCSLNPKVDRLCMVCEMRVNKEGKVTRATFYDAVMRSSARLTYSQVDRFLHGKGDHGIDASLHSSLKTLHDLYRAFAQNRGKRGAIELDLPQTKIRLSKDGDMEDIVAVPRNDAHRLIEECMIAANVQAAKFIRRHKIPGLYRVHAKPDPENFSELREYLLGLGFKVPHPEHVKPRDFSRLIKQAEGIAPTAQRFPCRCCVRSRRRSTRRRTSATSALRWRCYTLTLRRRFVAIPICWCIARSRHITRGGKPGRFRYGRDRMEKLGAVTSAYERRAEDATRDVEALLKCQFMTDKIGQEYAGVITGVTNFGVFVQISDLMIDGLVHVSNLDNDYYQFDPASMQLVGERSGKTFSMGDELRVAVQRVDLESRRIDFSLAGEAGRSGGRGRSSRRGRRRG